MFNASDVQQNTGTDTAATHYPKNCSVTTDGDDLLIHRRWSLYGGVKNLAWGIVIVGLMLTFYKAGGGPQLFATGLTDTLAVLVFGGGFLALGIYCFVLGIYQVFDTTTIRINTNAVSTEHHPIPWRTQSVSSHDIKQPFVTSHQVGYLLGSGPLQAQTVARQDYAVRLLMADGKQEVLIRQLPRIDQAHFIEAQIEQRLGIPDMRVKGEIKI